jgi:enterochelin esterase family protein
MRRWLIELDRLLVAGDMAALPKFWDSVAAQGTPIVEAVEGDPAQSWVTFLCRGDADTVGVSIADGPEGHDLHAHRLQRLRDSDVWFRTCRASNATRIEYEFLLNPVLVPGCESDHVLHGERHARWFAAHSARYREPGAVRVDPYNRRGDTVGASMRQPPGLSMSYLELSAAPPETWIVKREGIARGSIVGHTIDSQALKQPRPLWVYTPPGYAPDSATLCRLLVVFDGEFYRTGIPLHRVLDNLLADGRIEPTVAVMISNLGALRRKDLCYSESFTDFLATELIPWVRTHYCVTYDPAKSIVGGFSMGGLAAAYTGIRLSEVFGNVLSQSANFAHWPGRPVAYAPGPTDPQGWIAAQLASVPKLPLRFSIDYGSLEMPRTVALHIQLRDVLSSRGYFVRFNEVVGVDHSLFQARGTIADALLYLSDSVGPPAPGK